MVLSKPAWSFSSSGRTAEQQQYHMKKHLKTLLILTSLITLSGCGSTRVISYNSAADWVLAGPNCDVPSIYVMQGGKWTLVKGKVHIVEGSRIGPPTSR